MPLNIRIGNDQFNFFNNITVDLAYGRATSGFMMSGLYDSESAVYRRVFKPLDYKRITITTQRGERLITGRVLSHGFSEQAKRGLASLSGYNTVGVIQECSIAIGTPYQFINRSLREIAEQILQPFNLSVTVDNTGGLADEPISEERASPTETILSFLTRVAAQRNLVITSTVFGQLRITRPNVSRPSIATYREATPATRISLSVNGQKMHSAITAMRQASLDTDNVGQEATTNPLVNSFRPMTVIQSAGTNTETDLAARNVRSNELRNIGLIIESDRWEWLNNGVQETIMPDNIVTVISPENYIYRPTNFFVERVKLKLTEKEQTAQLFCVIPEVYNNQTPRNIFQ